MRLDAGLRHLSLLCLLIAVTDGIGPKLNNGYLLARYFGLYSPHNMILSRLSLATHFFLYSPGFSTGMLNVVVHGAD